MEATDSSETLITIYKTTQRHIEVTGQVSVAVTLYIPIRDMFGSKLGGDTAIFTALFRGFQ
jgi:hypothetical protein